MNVAITGASGFVGRNLVLDLERSGLAVVPLSRRPLLARRWRQSPILDRHTDPTHWARAFEGVDVVVHCAARTHVMDTTEQDPLDTFRCVNSDGAVVMATGAAMAGVRRLVFLSSVKVLGENTNGRAPFCNSDPAAPVDNYALSKAEAEIALGNLAKKMGLDLVVIRPPLVYGPGVGGNVLSLIRLIQRGVWLPLGRAHENLRSMISTTNLSGAIGAALTAPRAVGTALLVSDGADLSTCALVHGLATAAGHRARLISVPPGVLHLLLRLMKRDALWVRLFGNLQVEIAETCDRLSWQPGLSVAEGFASITSSCVLSRPAQ